MRFLGAGRLHRFGPRGAPVACLVLFATFAAMPPLHALHPGSPEDITVTAGPAGWQVQLGAFRSETLAVKARAALAQTLADLPRAGMLVIDDSKRDGLFRVVLADAFAHHGAAAAACAAITAHGAQCFTVRAVARGGAAPAPAHHLVPKQFDTLEAEVRQLRKEIEAIKVERIRPPRAPPSRAVPAAETTAAGFVRTDSKFGYNVLDPTTEINRKQRLILERRHDGTLAPDSLHVHGAVTAIANYQSSNRNDKFGYLMRHPTARNQVGDTVSEATIHSAQLGFTATLGDWVTGHAVMLFDPEQSFGDGTNTDIDRNQLQVRRAYVLFGDRDKTRFYASLGKMAVPFGLTDTVNPFSASTVWHVFGGLANGVTVGYANEGLSLSIMGIQGGAQFRAANTPVNGTAVPGRLNNFAADANYRFGLGSTGTLLLGGSYQHGTAYCQGFPIVHFGACEENNPAFDVYARLVHDDLMLKGEFARTTAAWSGTFNPGMPQFAASKVTSFDIGVRYRHVIDAGPVDVSAEFSRLVAGPDGAPWERQDQFVVGTAWFARPNAKLFAEYIHVEGYTPLNFLSGGSVRDDRGEVVPDQTQSDSSARSDVFMIGVNVAF
ncbi:MAG: SPOR domain-containing protein [Alphaproteobacteria bacterium]|nr:SPOR domain-containing protein [Alphaproteobacteria bacterium]